MIETTRLILKPFQDGDIDQLEPILGDPTVMRFSDNGPLDHPAQIKWLQKAQRNTHSFELPLTLAIHTRSNSHLIGYVLLSNDQQRVRKSEAELGFRLAHAWWGHGYATEVANAVVTHAQTISGIRRIVAVVDPNNKQSVGVLEKIGMAYETDIMLAGYTYPDHVFSMTIK